MNRWFFLHVALLFSVFSLSCLFGQQTNNSGNSGLIRGTVTVSGSDKPIFAANVLVKGTMMGSATDSRGRFVIDNVPPGNYTIKATAIGYKSHEREVPVGPGQMITLNFSLDETVIEMDGVAITASRYQQNIEDIPISISLMPAHEIRERNVTSLDEAMKYVPGVNSMEGGQVAIRGSSGFNWGMGSRVLLMLNGHPMMSGDNWSISWHAFPSSTIKQIEVMKGSGSALYGSSAMGGVINIITNDPAEGSHFSFRTHLGLYSAPSYNQWKWTDKQQHFEGTALDVSTHLGPVAMTLSTSIMNNTGYKENDDRQIVNFLGNFSYHLNENIRIDLLGGYGRRKGGFYVYWVDLENVYANGADPYGYSTRADHRHAYLLPSISYVLNNRVFVSIKGRYHSLHTEDVLERKIPDSPIVSDKNRRSDATTKGLEAQLNFQIFQQGILVAGADLQNDEVDAIQYGNRNLNKISYYLQYEQRLFDRLNLTLGTRYDAENGTDIGASDELSNKVGLTLAISKGTHLRASIGEGFRTPAIGERFVTTSTGGLRVVPNPGLKPEKSLSVEAGVRQSITRSMSLDLAGFYTNYDNLVEPQLSNDIDGSVVVRFMNVSMARIIGIDLSYRSDWWSKLMSSRLGYTYIKSEDLTPGTEPGTPLKYRPRHTVYFTNELTLNPFRLAVDLRFLSVIERVDEYHSVYIKDIDEVVPTYVIALRFGYERTHFSLRLVIDNLFQYYYLSAPANMGAPRTASLQFEVHY